jgi:predicted nucleotidyltransferase
VIALIEEHREGVRDLCERYRVRRLEVFGSAARADGFDSQESDLDFLVEFLPLQEGEHADAYFGLLEGLQMLFGRPVDLVMARAVKNPYFLEAVAQNREVVYAA